MGMIGVCTAGIAKGYVGHGTQGCCVLVLAAKVAALAQLHCSVCARVCVSSFIFYLFLFVYF